MPTDVSKVLETNVKNRRVCMAYGKLNMLSYLDFTMMT